MECRRRFTLRQVLDELFLDEDSDFEPDSLENSTQSSETSANNISPSNSPLHFENEEENRRETENEERDPEPSTSTGRRRKHREAFASSINNFADMSDSESDNSEPPPPPARKRGRGGQIRGGRGGQRGGRGRQNRGARNVGVAQDEWTEEDRDPDVVNFTGTPGIQVEIPPSPTALDYFSIFIGEEQLELFVLQTNIYAAQCIAAKQDPGPHSIFSKWKPVTLQEMKVFLALTINMGLVWKPEIRDYWSTDSLTFTPFWGSYMARDRYLAILAFFHLVNNEERDPHDTDKLFKVRSLFSHLESTFKSAYSPRRELSVDESMVPWRGRLSFRMFIPSKPTRYGVKLYCCCEAETGYVCRMQVYTGAGPNGPEKNHGENVVRRLVADFLGKGHVVYMDSFFSSVALFDHLRDNNTMAVGTVIAGRLGVPRCLHPKELKIKKGEFRFRRKGNLLCLRYHDRKNLLLLTTVHKAELAAVAADDDQAEAATAKPTAIIDYNQHMNGVDNFDQNLGYYSFHRKTIKWWKRMAMHLIHLSKVQAYILYSQNTPSPTSQHDFTKQLIRDLVSDVPMKKKKPRQNLPEIERLTGQHFLQRVATQDNKKYPSRLCVVCSFPDPSKQDRYIRKKESRYECEQCDKGLCLEPCFKLYHTRRDYKAAVVQVMNLNL